MGRGYRKFVIVPKRIVRGQRFHRPSGISKQLRLLQVGCRYPYALDDIASKGCVRFQRVCVVCLGLHLELLQGEDVERPVATRQIQGENVDWFIIAFAFVGIHLIWLVDPKVRSRVGRILGL